MRTSNLARPALAAAALLSALALVGCGALSSAQSPQGSDPSTSPSGGSTTSTPNTTLTPDPVSFTANVANKAKNVKVDTLVKVSAADGTLSKVSLSYDDAADGEDATVDGALAKDGSSWVASDRLDPGQTYTLKMTGASTTGVKRSTSQTFTTQQLTRAEQIYPTIFPTKGDTVGVGMPVILTFDLPVKDEAAFEKQLSVTTSPKQTGSWHWVSATEVHYRPKTYWKPGTKVSVDANLNGVNAGGGQYGQYSRTTNFTIGRSLITKINLQTDVAKVYENGKQVRTIYVSAGKPGWETRSGTKLIMAKEYNKVMTNEMIGAKEKYKLTAKYAMRITNSGEFLHSAPWNTGNFGVRNSSHGCTGMSIADSGWLYENTLIGDPVETTGTNRGMEQGNGWADWNLSWDTYKKGSAL